MFAAGVPRKLICVCGLAVPVPGSGETSTAVPARLALCASVDGRQEGELALAVSFLLWPKMPRLAEPLAIAATTHPRTATRRTMYPFRLMSALPKAFPEPDNIGEPRGNPRRCAVGEHP